MKLALTLFTALLLAPLAALHAAEPPSTFCNPLPIPNYPIGFFARNVTNGEPDAREGWLLGHREQFRELADPVVLWHDGKWYLYPSGDMAWVSADQGATWQVSMPPHRQARCVSNARTRPRVSLWEQQTLPRTRCSLPSATQRSHPMQTSICRGFER
jgi:hypothetical protein